MVWSGCSVVCKFFWTEFDMVAFCVLECTYTCCGSSLFVKDSMSVSLSKGSSLSLKKNDGSALSKVILGLGWDANKKKGLFGLGGEIDLDASAVLLDAGKNVVDSVWYGQKVSRDGSVKHSGDNLTGAGEGDDEQIVIDLSRIPANVASVVLTINSYSGDKFSQVKNVFARVLDASSSSPVESVRYDLADSNAGDSTANIVAKLVRNGSGWDFVALGVPATGKTVNDLTGVVTTV